MIPYYEHGGIRIFHGDCCEVLATLADESVHCCVTSPPYWGLRDYGVEGQLGSEPTLDEYMVHLLEVLAEIGRVLREDGTLWLNLGDSYCGQSGGSDGKHAGLHRKRIGGRTKAKKGAGLKPKDLVGVPWRVALALQAEGWYLRSDIIWQKPTAMPESVYDRPTRSHEYVFLLTKAHTYYYDADAVRTPLAAKTLTTYGGNRRYRPDLDDGLVKSEKFGRTMPERRPRTNSNGELAGANLRTVWTIPAEPQPGIHTAAFPKKLVEPCVKAGCPPGGVVLDPFAGSGTVLYVAREWGRDAVGIELNADYCEIAAKRMAQEVLPFENTK